MDLPKGIIDRLSKGGVSMRYVGEVMGVNVREAAALLRAAGAAPGTRGFWSLPGDRAIYKLGAERKIGAKK